MRIRTIPGAIASLLLAFSVAAPPLAAATPTVALLPNFRPIGGANNNQSNPKLNAVPGSPERAIAPLNFGPGTGNPLVSGPNPRTVSNVVSGQKGTGNVNAATPDPTASAWLYVFGQFVDHDLDLESTPANSPAINITIPPGDPVFAAGTSIALTRDQRDPSTNTIVNTVAGYLDLSQLYGSTTQDANDLRNGDGTLKSSGNGQYLSVINDQFVTGDVRVMENPELTAVTSLFMREHNYWVGQLRMQHPEWTGDQLYQMARAITTAEYENIVYQELVPLLVGSVDSYQGYKSGVNAQVTQEFSTAAFRLGHSEVSDTQEGLDTSGNVTFTESLAQSFFNTPEIDEANGFNPLLRGVSADSSQATDVYAMAALRNLLFAPLAGGDVDEVDLIAIDVQRERDVGLATLNGTRQALGMSRYSSFSQVTSDALLQKALNSVYGSVDNLDLFMGGLAEDHAQGARVGPTFQSILKQQFNDLRTGDRFFWLNQGFDQQTSAMIANTRLSDLIKRNTDSTSIQTNAFLAPNPPRVPGPVATTTIDNHGRLGTPFLLP